MNCLAPFIAQARSRPGQIALWMPGASPVSYGELLQLATRARAFLEGRAVGPGDSVLLLDRLSPRLYACIIGILSRGAAVVLVEPWMKVARIEQAVRLARPKLFLAGLLGMLWGARVAAIRRIGAWARTASAMKVGARATLEIDEVSAESQGIITFTTGTTGPPKGVVRGQGYLLKQHEVLSRHLESERHPGPDLCIFANFVLTNLASGRTSVLVPGPWKEGELRKLSSLPPALRPETLTCGPEFLSRLMAASPFESIRSVHVGGALSDCALLERGFSLWPEARWTHIYGSSEAEPVACADAREAVRLSRARGLFQTLHLGALVPEIRSRFEDDGLWVNGPHVCPRYLGNEEDNRRYKRVDAEGALWHFMGDRIRQDQDGLWFAGRSGQAPAEFELEQRIYSYLQSSRCFVQRDPAQRLWLVGEGLEPRREALLRDFPQLHATAELRILRDRRHQARIDRTESLRKGAPWLVG